MDPDVTWGNGRGCPLVVHCWTHLQLVHGFHCCDNIPLNAKCQRVLVLAQCLVFVVGTTDEISFLFDLQQVLSDLNKAMCVRLDTIESRLRTLDERTKCLETQMGKILQKQCAHSIKAE